MGKNVESHSSVVFQLLSLSYSLHSFSLSFFFFLVQLTIDPPPVFFLCPEEKTTSREHAVTVQQVCFCLLQCSLLMLSYVPSAADASFFFLSVSPPLLSCPVCGFLFHAPYASMLSRIMACCCLFQSLVPVSCLRLCSYVVFSSPTPGKKTVPPSQVVHIPLNEPPLFFSYIKYPCSSCLPFV